MEHLIEQKYAKCDKFVLSYGGGVNSSALFFYLVENEYPLDLVIFSDTGEESKQTYDAVKRMRATCEELNINFVIVRSELGGGNLYNYYYNNKIVMSMMRRDCTGKFKVSPIRKYLRATFQKGTTFGMYIGIAYDEKTRMRTSNVKYIENLYPFIYDKITRQGNIEILEEFNFVAKKSGCKGCMFQNKESWVKMLIDSPKEFERHRQLELNGSGFPKVLLNGTYSLNSIKEKFGNMKPLNYYFKQEEPQICDNINGGCFL